MFVCSPTRLLGHVRRRFLGTAASLVLVAAAHAQTTFTVTTTADAGPGSLRQALSDASGATTSTIEFNIPATDAGFNLPGTPGAWRIAIDSALPAVTRTTRINGLTQPGSSCVAPRIEVRPRVPQSISVGLQITANNAEVRGLCLNGFGGDAIAIIGATGCTVSCNFIGPDVLGGSTVGNDTGVRITNGATNTIGGSGGASTANLIAHNRGAGVAVVTTGAPSNVGNPILGNSIRDNGSLGIDLGDNGVTANDNLDLDVGPNHFQNHPVIDGYDGAIVQGSLSSLPNRRFRIELFANAASDPTGFGEGASFIGATEVATGTGGLASFSLPYVAPAGVRFITATATALPPMRSSDPLAAGGQPAAPISDRGVAPAPPTGTSEFSPTFQVAAGPNSPPTAVDDAYSTDEDTTLVIGAAGMGVLANDTDVEPGPLTAELVSPASRGVVTLNPNGTFSYVPNLNANGLDTFTYRAIDSGGAASPPATVRISVQPVNDAPFAIDDNYATDEDSPLVIASPASGVLANDVDAERDPLTALLVAGPSSGTLTFSPNGTFTYAPAPNFAGGDSFTYRASDGAMTSGVATVTISVRGANDPPVAVDDEYTTNEDTPLTVSMPAMGVLANDTDPDQPPQMLTAALVTTTARGALTFSPNGTFNYTPQPNFNGIDTFTYRASDGQATSNIATVTITVRAVNDPPVARNDSFFTNEDTVLNVAPPGILDNDADVDDARDTLTITIVTPPSSGALTNVLNGGFRYTPNTDFVGVDQFTYRLTDPAGAMSGLATVTIQVLPLNDAPVARPDSFTMDEDTVLDVPAPGVLANDFDPDVPPQPLTAELISPPDAAATFSFLFNPDGSFSFAPVGDFAGTLTFTYSARDAALASPPATVTITVRPINDPPVALDDAYEVSRNTPLSVPASLGVLANDFDIDDPPAALTAARISGPANGSLTLNADGSFTYTPAADFTGPDAFTYQASDGREVSNTATVSIIVRGDGGNQPPVARCRDITIDATATCPGDITITPGDVDNGSFDPDDATDTLTFAVTPSGPFPPGVSEVTLRVTDPDGLFSTCIARVTVLISDCNRNGRPDACEIADGSAADCNRDGVPDACQCLWDNGMAESGAGGRLSQVGGRAQVVSRVMDDFYLEPDRMHQVTSFTGQLLTSAAPATTRVRVEFFNDCNGAPDGRPFAGFDNGVLVSSAPADAGFSLATYSFDLCDQALWLEGGKTYWVAFHGIIPCSERGEVFWAMASRSIMGTPPRTSRGMPSPYQCVDVMFGPWLPIETCCGLDAACRNMAYKLGGASCPLLWDNGEYQHCPGGGGVPSGRNGQQMARAADNFVVKPCEDPTLCFIEATIWTNGNPNTGFFEVYANDCRQPTSRLFAAPATRAIPLSQSIAIGPFTVHAYRLQLIQPNWRLEGGRTYWLSAGITNAGGSISARSYFAVADRCGSRCDIRISPAWMGTVGTRGDVGWCPAAPDLAFRIFARQATPSSPVLANVPSAACPVDLDGSGDAGPQDLFTFLAAWFSGCP